ncbi:hypothetical protein BV898_10758 [Hypsibius exemplaris]|uniref:Uncharacterized protein n=1 Tax=Hypsibius exemplaris TaxID=2072580 RepID=A0A1W0WIG2_HYPEX|nr:hypothetical protein BV898_10758 [Hypsibius exemplaris]
MVLPLMALYYAAQFSTKKVALLAKNKFSAYFDLTSNELTAKIDKAFLVAHAQLRQDVRTDLNSALSETRVGIQTNVQTIVL